MNCNQSSFSSTRPARILIVDDHPIVREGLALLLASYPELTVSGQAENIVGTLLQIDQNPPDLAVIDIALKNESGLDLIRRIREKNKNVRILAISMYDESIYGERVLAAGASGFLNKQSASRNIVEAIRLILSGKIFLSDELSEQLVTRQLTGNKLATSGVASLTDRELEVYTMIGNGTTTAEIAENLHLSIKTVETHRRNIKSKLGLTNAAELSREAAQWVLLNR